ncbi:MAG: cysteine desulfurase family protein [Anaerolineales bacterium]
MTHIYLDYAATTPVDDRVVAAMQPYYNITFGNPSSIHLFGQQSELALENARETLAKNINALPSEIVFTSSGSESDNLALRGIALAARQKRIGNHLLISPIEHPAVLQTADQLAKLHGFKVSYLPVDRYGVVTASAVLSTLRDDTILVSVMGANNEVGTINPISEIGEVCQDNAVPFHTDAVQYAAHQSFDVNELKVDLLSMGAHKFYGPKGVGALYIRSGLDILPILTGGSQEFGLRAATQNVPQIVGMAEAFQMVQDEGTSRRDHVLLLRDQIINYVLKEIPASQLTGHPQERLPNHASFVFEGADGNTLIQVLDAAGFACSSGSACKTGDPKPSSALIQLGYEPSWALGSLRVTLGVNSSKDEVMKFLEVLPGCVEKVRGLTN